METDLLREFTVLASHLNYSSASRALNIAQSTLSRHIMELERHYGVTLFNRAQNISLTPAGQLLLEEVDALIDLEDRIAQKLAAMRTRQPSSVRVQACTFSTALRFFLRRCAHDFQRERPEITFESIPVQRNESIAASLDSGRFDIGFYTYSHRSDDEEPSIPEAYRLAPLKPFDSPWFFCLDKKLLAPGQTSIALEQLQHASFILPLRPEWVTLRDNLTELCEEVGFTPQFTLRQLDSYEDIAFFDMDNSVFVIDEALAQSPDSPFQASSQCAIARCEDDITVSYCLMYREDGITEALSSFLEFVESETRTTGRPDLAANLEL